MKVDLYEKWWMWLSGALIVFFIAAIVFITVAGAVVPPSHIETIDPTTLATDPRFSNPGVTTAADGSQQVVVRSLMYAFLPIEIRVTAGVPVTFRMTSSDVLHGFQIVGTNANALTVPGYVSQFTITFPEPGEYLIVCNEFCGLGHHIMQGSLIVESAGGDQ